MSSFLKVNRRHYHHLFVGKTRTRDKYRIVYTDRQRHELELEFVKSKYISIPRKAALSSILALSERQVSTGEKYERRRRRRKKRTTIIDSNELFHSLFDCLRSRLKFGFKIVVLKNVN
jgi:hypothetical protein